MASSISGQQRVKVGTWPEIAQALGIGVRKAQELRYVLPIFYVGKTPFAYVDELEAWIRDNKARVDRRRRPVIAEIPNPSEATENVGDDRDEAKNSTGTAEQMPVKPGERAAPRGGFLIHGWRWAASATLVVALAGSVVAVWSHRSKQSEGRAKGDAERSQAVFARAYDIFVAGNIPRAVDLLNKAERLDANNANVYQLRGFCLRTLGRNEDAIRDQNKAILLKPDSARSYYERGRSYVELGKLEPALVDFGIAIRLEPDLKTSDEYYLQRGTLYRKFANSLHSREEYLRALDDFSGAIRCNHENGAAYHRRGATYAALNENERALADYNAAEHLLPKEQLHWLYTDRAAVKDLLGDHEGARRDRLQAVNLQH